MAQNYKLMRTKRNKSVSKISNVTKTKLIVTFHHIFFDSGMWKIEF